jgi:hypothetical protein
MPIPSSARTPASSRCRATPSASASPTSRAGGPTALADYRWNERWSTSLGARYSSRQFRTLNNSDTNGYAYMGVSPLFVVDVRARAADRQAT